MTHGIAIAEWLLAAFGVDDTLRGDIAEERAAGRSFAWLAGQTAAAIAAQVARDLRGHPVLAMRAIATGYLLTMAWSRLGPAFWPHPSETNHNSVVTYRLLTVFVWPVIVGWAVARLPASVSATHAAIRSSRGFHHACSAGRNPASRNARSIAARKRASASGGQRSPNVWRKWCMPAWTNEP